MRKSRLTIFFILSHIMMLSGCVERENDVEPDCQSGCGTISGYLTTGAGTDPLESANLAVYWKNTQYLSGGTVRTKAVTTTDANGYYELNFQIREEELEDGYFDAEIFVDAEEYVLCGQSNYGFAFHDLARDTSVQVNYFIPRKAFIKLGMANQDEIQGSDYFASSFGWKMGINGEQGCRPVITWSSGLPTNTLLEVASDQPIIVTTHKTKNGVKTTTYDTLNLEVGEKIVYTAEF